MCLVKRTLVILKSFHYFYTTIFIQSFSYISRNLRCEVSNPRCTSFCVLLFQIQSLFDYLTSTLIDLRICLGYLPQKLSSLSFTNIHLDPLITTLIFPSLSKFFENLLPLTLTYRLSYYPLLKFNTTDPLYRLKSD